MSRKVILYQVNAVNFQALSFTIELTAEKRLGLIKLVLPFLTKETCTIRNFAKLLGCLVAAYPAVVYGWMYCKRLEQAKYLSLLIDNDYDSKMTISQAIHEDLHQWIEHLSVARNPIRIFFPTHPCQVGAFCAGNTARGFWEPAERAFHINYLELLAVIFGLRCFCSRLTRLRNRFTNRQFYGRFIHQQNGRNKIFRIKQIKP